MSLTRATSAVACVAGMVLGGSGAASADSVVYSPYNYSGTPYSAPITTTAWQTLHTFTAFTPQPGWRYQIDNKVYYFCNGSQVAGRVRAAVNSTGIDTSMVTGTSDSTFPNEVLNPSKFTTAFSAQSSTTVAAQASISAANGAGCYFYGPSSSPAGDTATRASTVGLSETGSAVVETITPANNPDTATPTSGRLDISWSGSVTAGVSGYRVQHSTDGSTWSNFSSGTCSSVVTTGTSCTGGGLSAGTAYYLKVTGQNSTDDSPTLTSARATTATTTPTNRPSTPSVSASPGDGEVELSWSAPASNGSAISDYTAQWSTNGTDWSSFSSGSCSGGLGSGATSCTGTGLTNGTPYNFRLVASNGVGDSDAGTASTTPTATPASPGPGGVAGGELTWGAPDWASPISSYTVLYRESGSSDRWGVYARGSTNRQVELDALVNDCQATNQGLGWTACPLPYGVPVASSTYEFSVFARTATDLGRMSTPVGYTPGGVGFASLHIGSAEFGSDPAGTPPAPEQPAPVPADPEQPAPEQPDTDTGGGAPQESRAPEDAAAPPETAPDATPFLTRDPAPATRSAARAEGTVTARADNRRQRVLIDAGPDLTQGSYRVLISRKTDHGWKTIRTARTKGSSEKARITLPRGRYRVLLPAQKQTTPATSSPVRITR